MAFTAAEVYGGRPHVQPTPTPDPAHLPGTPEPRMRTEPREPGGGNAPVMLLVAILGVGLLISQVI